MVRTEDDIRQALDTEPNEMVLARLHRFVDAVNDEPAAQDPATESLAELRPQRHPWAPLAAAAAVVLTVSSAAVVAVERQRARSSGEVAAAAGVLSPAQLRPTWDIAVKTVPGYTSEGISAQSYDPGSFFDVNATSRTRPERGYIDTCAASLTTCPRPPQGVTAQKVTVAGRTAYFYPGQRGDYRGQLIDSSTANRGSLRTS